MYLAQTQCSCSEYNVLDESDRSITTGKGTNADKITSPSGGNISPDFQGPGCYRMQAPAGIVIPESSPGKNKCGTYATGWMQDTHPTEIGVAKTVTFCFHWGNECTYTEVGQVTLCEGDFYVYYLPEATSGPSGGLIRYCAADEV